MGPLAVGDMRFSQKLLAGSITHNVPINDIFQQNPFLNEARRNEVAAEEKQGHNDGKDLELRFPKEREYAGEVDVAHEETNDASDPKHAGCPSVP